ncbi:pseudouridine synthase [Obba rivulosa]|uniref:Pseudouridine synthase n=1 Tax=Obba rivulosa TaxID=1052685 RepID=A0A8E2ATH4_9APHY|nr:pseudouridine synthase [Obba rivulosa]
MPPCAASVSRLGTRKASTWARNALYIDRGLLLVNKPPGIVCQYNRKDSAEEEEHPRFRDFINDFKEEFELENDPLPVHRLDKETTGVFALALHATHARELSRQFSSRTVEKTYLALVIGGKKTFTDSSGVISDWIQYFDGRPAFAKVPFVKPNEVTEKRSETGYEVLAMSPKMPLSLVKLRPLTGHKHQLRVHMARTFGAPILGDALYSHSEVLRVITDTVTNPEDRIFLHASSLRVFRFRREGTPKRASVMVCAPLPDYFVRACEDASIPLDKDVITGGLWIDGERIQVGQGEPDEGAKRGLNLLQGLSARWFGS